ncbi:MAG TPA: hypothetical protein VK864_08055, partial [Longimicrobiales bacterium]|nr:hypothetical protein [Longimicrobiales bacterium]
EGLYERIERDALFNLPEDAEDEPPLDVLAAAAGGPAKEASSAADLTLGGYIALHERPPAFEGSDGQPYTVAVDTEATNDPERPFVAFFVFVRWAATGAGIMQHLESPDVAFGGSEAEARAAALELTLYEVRAELDAAIERRKELEE